MQQQKTLNKSSETAKANSVPSKDSSVEKQLPVKKLRAGGVVATCWKNEGTDKDGRKFTLYTVSVQRSYLDKDNTWKNTNNLRMNDVLKTAELLKQMFNEFGMTEQGSEDVPE